MIPAPFDYVRAETIDQAIDELAAHGDDAKLLAGGHSLLPLMKLRLATPAMLVDIGNLAELAFVRDDGGHLAIGPLTCHDDLHRSELVTEQAPLLAHVAGQIGDPQVRHRGTIGGSIAHGDPASDLPAALLASRAAFVVRGPSGERTIAVDDFFTGFLETALRPDEMLVEIRVPKNAGAAWSFEKIQRRALDWAIVAVACVRNGTTGIGLVNAASTPMRSAAAEEALDGGGSIADAAAIVDRDCDPPSDINASAAYRRNLLHVLTRRALERASA